MYLYLNGSFIKKEEAFISPYDHGFLYGIGLFETFRVYDGHPFLLDDHLARLNHGLAEWNIHYRFERESTFQILQELLNKNGLKNAYIRLNVSAGIGDIGFQVEPYTEPNIIIFPKSLPPAGEMTEKKAITLKLKRNTPEGIERLKSHHFMNNILAKREIGNSGDREGIFLTEEGKIAEGIVSNVFWKKGNGLYTPALSTGILNGITRQFVMELARQKGYNVQEGHYSIEDVLQAEEMFVTNSIQEIVPITNFDGQVFPGKSGAFVQQLHYDYRRYSKYLWSRQYLR
ncbi:aminodeoxychorismate lyase [Neobacillus sedimentimangrovi]|uniref:aminodeoxychorismate lyase n=1 Tax=Neobacillus sedimentimangrovi TaxID=2699460 RepID=UPI0013D6150C|nr:aminodeoxychorismate lyase [Neobacillus sedimentimangrovi]